MRWDDLFDDLESQLEQGLDADADARMEEERLRIARLALRDRLAALAADRRSARGIRIALVTGDVVAVRPLTIGKDWLSGDLVDAGSRQRQCIVPLSAIHSLLLDREEVIRSLHPPDVAEALVARLGFAFVLRDLARRRVGVDLAVLDGRYSGTVDRVGRDHLDLAHHEPGEARRESAVVAYRIVPLASIVAVIL